MKKKFSYAAMTGVLVALLFCGASAQTTQKIRVLIVTGGHGFEHVPFYDIFNAMKDVVYDTLIQPLANDRIASPAIAKYDVLVFYDMFDSLSTAGRQAYVQLLKKGKAMIFLHHSLVSYQRWPEFLRMVGGQYHTRPVVVKGDTLKANYEHDVKIPVMVADKSHPITQGISDFLIVDERYGQCEILETVKPLLTTSDPKSMRPLAWINHYGNSDIVYIQLGHGPTAYGDSNYRRLVHQAIVWSATRHH
jgi:uncharacterized protein